MDCCSIGASDHLSIYSENEPMCRICWSEKTSPTDPLIKVCQCSGGIAFIHYTCLKHWLKTKLISKNYPNIVLFAWKNFQCEICKDELPFAFRNNGRIYNLVEVPKLSIDHLMLESQSMEGKSVKLLYILVPKLPGEGQPMTRTYKIGRNYDCDITLPGISASRYQSEIIFDGKAFRFHDSLSKFGTLIRVRKPLTINQGMETSVQVGKHLIVMKPMDKNLRDTNIGNIIEKRREEGLKSKSRRPRRFLHDAQGSGQAFSPRTHMQKVKQEYLEEVMVKQEEDHEKMSKNQDAEQIKLFEKLMQPKGKCEALDKEVVPVVKKRILLD